MNCKYCDKECKSKISLIQHEIRCFENPNKIRTKHSEDTKNKLSKIMKVVNTNSTRVLSKESVDKIKQSSKEFNKNYWTDEKRKEHSLLMSKIIKENPDSYSINNVSGRAKIVEYNGFKLKGSWELMIAKILDNLKIKWTNIIEPFPYFWNEEWHLYFPDFYLIDYNKYIEVKGYERERDLKKWECVKNLVVLKGKEIELLKLNDKKIFEYIKK
jgi:hypothetical protein